MPRKYGSRSSLRNRLKQIGEAKDSLNEQFPVSAPRNNEEMQRVKAMYVELFLTWRNTRPDAKSGDGSTGTNVKSRNVVVDAVLDKCMRVVNESSRVRPIAAQLRKLVEAICLEKTYHRNLQTFITDNRFSRNHITLKQLYRHGATSNVEHSDLTKLHKLFSAACHATGVPTLQSSDHQWSWSTLGQAHKDLHHLYQNLTWEGCTCDTDKRFTESMHVLLSQQLDTNTHAAIFENLVTLVHTWRIAWFDINPHMLVAVDELKTTLKESSSSRTITQQVRMMMEKLVHLLFSSDESKAAPSTTNMRGKTNFKKMIDLLVERETVSTTIGQQLQHIRQATNPSFKVMAPAPTSDTLDTADIQHINLARRATEGEPDRIITNQLDDITGGTDALRLGETINKKFEPDPIICQDAQLRVGTSTTEVDEARSNRWSFSVVSVIFKLMNELMTAPEIINRLRVTPVVTHAKTR